MDKPANPRTKWFVEAITPELWQLSSVIRTVYTGQTRFQQAEILDTAPFGRMLVLDGKTQSSAADEEVYHEGLVHPALIAHPHPRRVFIGGGGEGATLREVLIHKTVEKAVMCDLDKEVVDLCKEHLPQWHRGAFDDPRTELLHEDAYAYLKRQTVPFDTLILDLVDPMEAGPAHLLYTKEFYEMARDRLSPNGTVVVQAGPAIAGIARVTSTSVGPHGALVDTSRSLPAIARTLSAVFPTVACYSVIIPAFGSAWGFILASKGSEDPAQIAPAEIDRRIGERLTRETHYYDGTGHRAMFSLPKPLRKAIASETWVISEAHPLYVP